MSEPIAVLTKAMIAASVINVLSSFIVYKIAPREYKLKTVLHCLISFPLYMFTAHRLSKQLIHPNHLIEYQDEMDRYENCICDYEDCKLELMRSYKECQQKTVYVEYPYNRSRATATGGLRWGSGPGLAGI